MASLLNNDHQYYFQNGVAEETDCLFFSPQGFAVNADLLEDVFEELRSTLLHHMMDPQTCLQVLEEALHKAYKVLCSADAARNSLCSESRVFQTYLGTEVTLKNEWMSLLYKSKYVI